MQLKLPSRLYMVLIVALSSLLLFACAPNNQYLSQPTPEGSLPVDPVFREFYLALGGYDLLGPAISGMVEKDQLHCQYTANALLCYDPNASDTEHFSLFPLGRGFGIQDDPSVLPDQGGRVVDGFTIYPGFVTTYDRMHGARYVGHPLTQVRINNNQNRIEQYFENMGFYSLLNGPKNQVHLISYGAYACQQECEYAPETTSAIIANEANVAQPFGQWILRIGGVAVFGQPLTKPYVSQDGSIQQVYEKAVFSSQPGGKEPMHMVPIPLMMGTSFSLPAEKINDSRMVFYTVQANLGYNVPVVFDRFITLHGGSEISGKPISEVMKVPDQNLYRQCFENYCIDFDPAASAELQVRLAPLGIQYIDFARLAPYAIPRFTYAPETVIMALSESKAEIQSSEEQEIRLTVLRRNNQTPIAKVGATVSVYLPNGQVIQDKMPLTGPDGSTTYKVAPQPDIPNGTMIVYQVCLSVQSESPICAQESYLVWNAQ